MMVRLLAFVIVSAFCLIFVISQTSLSQQPEQIEYYESDAKKPKRESVDLLRCLACHEKNEKSIAYKTFVKEGRDKFIVLDEVSTWAKNDLHSLAFQNIKPKKSGGADGNGNLAWKMQEILRTSRGKNYEVHRAAECLVCHAVDSSTECKLDPQSVTVCTADPVTSETLDDWTKPDPRFDVRFGVSCEACHGIVNNAWDTKHAELSWREVDSQDKLKQGQLDLRNPRLRTERCASCHVGSASEHKFVTHEMYAAGHPPLPVLETSTFTKMQPDHFHNSRTNKYFNAEHDAQKTSKEMLFSRFNFRAGESAEVRNLAYGSVVNLRSNLDLFEKDAATGKLLDFAHFDCAACHHDLKSPSDRQNRKGGITGRPMMKAQTELLDVVLGHAASPKGDQKLDPQWVKLHETFRTELKTLQDAFTARPFGDSTKIQTAAKALNATTETILKELKPIVYDRDTSLALYNAIRKRLESYLPDGQAKADYLDHDSAQQLAWALLSLHRELSEMGLKEDPGWKIAEVKLGETIGLALREPYNKDEPLASVERRLKKRLEKQYDFRTDDFFKAVKALPK